MPQTIQDLSLPGIVSVHAPRPSHAIIMAGASGVIAIAASVFAYQAVALSADTHTAHNGNAVGGTGVLASAPARTREVTIGNNGLIYIEDATLATVSGNLATVTINWGSAAFSWQAEITGATKIIHSDGSPGSYADLRPGQSITVTGMLDTKQNAPSIFAQYIRE